MKKILNYLLWLPFAVSISSFVLYFVTAVKIKLKNTFVTESIQNTLKMYLIIGLISLFIGLLIVFVKKVIKLFKPDNNVKEIKTIKNEKNDDKNIFMLKIVNPVFSDNKIIGTLEETDQHIEVYIEKKKKTDVNFDTVSCPECSGLISKDAAICPHCGVLFDEKIINIVNDNKKKLQKKNKKFSLKKFILDTLLILLFMVLTFLVVNLLINKSAENYNNVNGTNVVSEK